MNFAKFLITASFIEQVCTKENYTEILLPGKQFPISYKKFGGGRYLKIQVDFAQATIVFTRPISSKILHFTKRRRSDRRKTYEF